MFAGRGNVQLVRLRAASLLVLALCTGRSMAATESSGETDAEAARSMSGGQSNGTRDAKLEGPFRHIGDDLLYCLTFPTRTDERGATVLAVWGGVTLAAYGLDDEIRRETLEHRGRGASHVADGFEKAGRWWVPAVAGAALSGAGRLSGTRHLAEIGDSAIEAYILDEIFMRAAKGVIERRDPGERSRASEFFRHGGEGAFPSGHTSRAFAFATVVAGNSKSRTAAVLSYGTAALIGLARIEQDVHWTSDVVAGAGLGIAVGRAVLHRRAERKRGGGAGGSLDDRRVAFAWRPSPSGPAFGAKIRFRAGSSSKTSRAARSAGIAVRGGDEARIHAVRKDEGRP